MASLLDAAYNPDVLSCLANLSNDEVFTPPELANQVLDLLPAELWEDPSTKILDPFCKTGVFLREAAKRLVVGLEPVIPDLQERVDHIMHEQLYGIAITELTALLSRRSVYCSKYPNGIFSVSHFDDDQGSIRYRNIRHTWKDGRCVYCGASEKKYRRDASLESHAYELIHTTRPEEIFNMKFDVIVGNPPYQLSDGGNNASSIPIYQHFVQQAKKLNPRYLAMIIPSRYFAGGKGLNDFRAEMLGDRHITRMVDYINAKDCFPSNSIGGGVNYFLWERDREAACEVTTILGSSKTTAIRDLDEFPVFVRHNSALSVIHKVRSSGHDSISSVTSSRNPFGYPTSSHGTESKKCESDYRLISSKGASFVQAETLAKGKDLADGYKVMVSRIIYEHACEPDKEGKMRVLSRIDTLCPHEVCTDSYLVLGPLGTKEEADNLNSYLRTKFARFLIAQALSSINLSKDKFAFVPLLDYSKKYTDTDLFELFGLSDSEAEYIEGFIHEMPEVEG